MHVFVSGRVQGVWYLQSCAHEASARGLRGWARNLADGRVELWLEGGRGDVEEVLSWCRRGPSRAQVSPGGSQFPAGVCPGGRDRVETGGSEVPAYVAGGLHNWAWKEARC